MSDLPRLNCSTSILWGGETRYRHGSGKR